MFSNNEVLTLVVLNVAKNIDRKKTYQARSHQVFRYCLRPNHGTVLPILQQNTSVII